ncbi:MAG: hypothetical protein BWY64_02494 [bacterium ADurb.Bin363]|nr:MAG: hypothetical protein BWY64_02494 [bacterium ADurb.Bin363]
MKICKFCEYPIIRGTIKVCSNSNCKAIYHIECWNVNSRCTACMSTNADTVKPRPTNSHDENSENKEHYDKTHLNNNPHNNYKTNSVENKIKTGPRYKTNFLKSLRWQRVGLIAFIIPCTIFFIFLIINLISSIFEFGKDAKLYASGVKKLEQNKYNEATALFEDVLNLNPKYPDLEPKLVEAYKKLFSQLKDENNYNKALDILQKTNKLRPETDTKQDLIDLYLQWGEYLLTQKSYQPATEKFEYVLKIDKTDKTAKEKLKQVCISIIYDIEYEPNKEQIKRIINDKEYRNKIEKDGIKLYNTQCEILKSDLNNDGSKDIIVAGADADSAVAGVEAYQIKTGKPELLISVDTTGYYLNKMVAFDLNNDKHYEIFTDWTEKGTTKSGFTILLFSKGQEITFRNSNKISTCPLSYEDINNDGKLEIIGKKLYEGIKIDEKDFFLPYIYDWQNYEFVDVSSHYRDYYKKIYIDPLENKLTSIPEGKNYLEKVYYEEQIRKAITKLYNVIGLNYNSKTGGTTPEETIQINFDYINQHEFYKAYLLRSNYRRTQTSFDSFYNFWHDNIAITIHEITLVSKSDNKAEVQVTFEATDQINLKETRTQVYKGTYYMIKEFDLWYLDDSKVVQ